jgi:hypothetical protein
VILLAYAGLLTGVFRYFRKEPSTRTSWGLSVPIGLLCICIVTFRSERRVIITSVSQLESGVSLGGDL